MKPKLTNEGFAAQIRALDGEGIVFSKFKLGNGDVPADYRILTDLQNPLATVGLTSLTTEENSAYAQLEGTFNNSNTATGFYWKEVGIFIQDPDDNSADLLYAYGHVDLEEGLEMASSIPAASVESYEIKLTYRVYVGEAEDLSAILAESSIYATKEDFDTHLNDQTNPHGVTAEQVGLGNVPNLATDDLTPTVSVASSLTELAPGDVLSTIIGKVAKAITTLISHIANTTMHVTASERSTWNSKANASHNHSASQINSGTLGISRGGTGATTAAAAAKALLASGVEGIGKLIFKPGAGNAVCMGGIVTSKKAAWRLAVSASENLSGTEYVELATGGDGDEPVRIRQYTKASSNSTAHADYFSSAVRTAYLLNASGNTIFPGSCTATSHPTSSDKKKKDVHGALSVELSKAIIMGLKAVQYNFKGFDRNCMGFLAQDAYAVMKRTGIQNAAFYKADKTIEEPGDPESTITEDALPDEEIDSADDADLDWSLDYSQLIAPLVTIIQDQERRISELEAKQR